MCQGFGSEGAAVMVSVRRRTPEAAPTSDKANANRLQGRPATGQSWTTQWQW